MACEFISGLNHWSLAGVTSSLKSAKKNVTPSVLAGLFAATTVVLGESLLHFVSFWKGIFSNGSQSHESYIDALLLAHSIRSRGLQLEQESEETSGRSYAI